MNLSLRKRWMLKWAGLPLLAVVTFVMTMHWTFPYDRLKGRIEQVLASKYIVNINKIEPTFFPGGVILKTVVLESKPSTPDEPVTKVVIDELRVDVGLLGLVRGRFDVDLVADIAGGKITANVDASKSGLTLRVSTSSLSLANVPGVMAAVGLPMTGELNADFNLKLPKNKWAKASGTIKISCPECTVGDGKTKVKPRARPGVSSYRRKRRELFIGDGVPVPKLSLGDFAGEIEIKDGVGTIKRLAGKSPDGELIIEGVVNFKDPFKNSTMPACLRFKVSDALGKRDPKFANFPALMGVPPIADGWSHVKAKGKLTQLRWVSTRGKPCVPAGRKTKRGKSIKSRPRVTTRGATRRIPPKAQAKPGIAKPGAAKASTTKPTASKPPTTARKRSLSELKPGGSGPKLSEAVKRANKKRHRRKRKDDVRAADDDDDDGHAGDDDDDDDDGRAGDDDDDDDDRGDRRSRRDRGDRRDRQSGRDEEYDGR